MRTKLVIRILLVATTVTSLLRVAPVKAEDTIKVGILHSLSGNMAVSESVLKDTVLMLIADQNSKGGLLGKKLEPVAVDPAWQAPTLTVVPTAEPAKPENRR